jgi:hypothetical protein
MSHQDERRYPIGPFEPRREITAQDREELIGEITELPSRLKAVIAGLTREQLDDSYRDGGWTVRQVVHHLPDSHVQGYVRFKLAVTEESPTIKTYSQSEWGETADAREAPVDPSLMLLDALHRRWAYFLRSLSETDFARTYHHPELGEISLDTTLQLYAWHGKHHLGHVKLVAERR